ncbi:MAG: lamin tail domain-containing protein [Bacteroidales bacterium]|nr:lamin tail domain-containing protein [Bacteroidales bacterium]
MKRLLIVMALCCAGASVRAQQGVLLISELLYQPLSGEAEYVELYNAGNTPLELADYHIVRWVGDSLGRHYVLPQHTVAPHDYVALTKDAASVTANYTLQYLNNLVECTLPTYPNSGGSVILASADSLIIDRFDYTPSMHSRLLRNKAGVSLERRSFERPTNEASNWFSAASTAGYGTPGYANSQSTEQLVEENSFEFSSALLSPDGDGYQDELEINYQLEAGDLVARAEVYNTHGLMVRRLLNNALLGTAGILRWDALGENGQPLPEGQYIVRIIIYDTAGTRQTLRRNVALVTR